jgi:hypothetical protein
MMHLNTHSKACISAEWLQAQPRVRCLTGAPTPTAVETQLAGMQMLNSLTLADHQPIGIQTNPWAKARAAASTATWFPLHSKSREIEVKKATKNSRISGPAVRWCQCGFLHEASQTPTCASWVPRTQSTRFTSRVVSHSVASADAWKQWKEKSSKKERVTEAQQTPSPRTNQAPGDLGS